jgi:hypothetical protein
MSFRKGGTLPQGFQVITTYSATFLATDPEARVRFPALSDFLKKKKKKEKRKQ